MRPIEVRTSDGTLIGVITSFEKLDTVPFKCSKHGDVKGHVNRNKDVYCPECLFTLPTDLPKLVNKRNEFPFNLSMSCDKH